MTTYIVSAGVTSSGITLNVVGDDLTVLKGGTAVSTSMNGPVNNGSGFLDDFGKTIGTVINDNGNETVESGGVAIDTILKVSGGGYHGFLMVGSVGIASGTIINSGADAYAQGGSVTGTMVASGGFLEVGNGVATGTVLNGGQTFDQGSFQSFCTIINSGGEEVDFGNSVDGARNAVVNSGGTQAVEGANAYNTTVNNGGVLSITAANPFGDEFVTGMSVGATIGSGGLEVVAGGPIADGVTGQAITYGTLVSSGGQENVHAGGTASGTIVEAGGHIALDATATGTVLNGGTMWDNAGGTANGTTVLNGGNEIVYGNSLRGSGPRRRFSSGHEHVDASGPYRWRA